MTRRCGLAFVIEGGMENWGAIFLERDLDASAGVAALAPAAYGGAMMLGQLSGQWLERRVNDTALLAGAMSVALLGLVGAAAAPIRPRAAFAALALVAALLGVATTRLGNPRA